jgi:hypothetical protein
LSLQVILSTKPEATIGGNLLPVSYSKFTSMVNVGDTIFLGRYLVTGSEESSCYLTVGCLKCQQISMHFLSANQHQQCMLT